MGNLCSGGEAPTKTSGGSSAASQQPTVLDLKLCDALKVRAQENAAAGKKFKTFNSVMMKFAEVESGFAKAKSTFREKDRDGNGSIDLEEFMEASNDLKFDLSDDLKKRVFEESDFDGNRQIDFKEFVVMLALIHLLEATGASKSNSFFSKSENAALRNAIDLATDAFLFFDVDGSGYISKDEVLTQMDDATPHRGPGGQRGSISREETGGAGSSTSAAAAGGGVVTVNPLGDRPSMDKDKRSSLKHNSHKTDRSLTAQRFAEMDWDTNGQVSFKEFLFAFEGWVGLDEDEDE